MKKGFFFLLFLGILYTSLFNCRINNPCWYNSEGSQHRDKIISEKETAEYSKGNENNQTFLGLSFGMTLPETYNKLLKLRSEKIITELDTCYGILGAAYEMNYCGYSNFGRIYCFYNENKLQEVQIDTLQQNSGNMIDLFIRKYGDCDYFAENELNNEYHWIKGNQHITLYSFVNSDRLLVSFQNTEERVKYDNINLLEDWEIIKENV